MVVIVLSVMAFSFHRVVLVSRSPVRLPDIKTGVRNWILTCIYFGDFDIITVFDTDLIIFPNLVSVKIDQINSLGLWMLPETSNTEICIWTEIYLKSLCGSFVVWQTTIKHRRKLQYILYMTRALRGPKLPANGLFHKQLMQTNNWQTIRDAHYWSIVRRIHRRFPYKWLVMRKAFPRLDVIMTRVFDTFFQWCLVSPQIAKIFRSTSIIHLSSA